MGHDYSWEQSSSYAEPRGDGFGWAVLVAVVLALLIHVGFFLWMSGTLIKVEITETEEWVSEPMRVEASDMEVAPITEAPPEEEIDRPMDDGELISSVEDVLPDLVDTEIDIAPLAEDSLPDLKIEKPALSGSEEGDLLKATVGPSVLADIPEPGQIDHLFPEAKAGQVIVDQGKPLSDVFDPNVLAKELGQKKGAGGNHEKGAISGYTGLAAYAKMAPGDLQKNKASIGSDLLFEFGKSSLRDDARLTLMTVAMLIDRNPNMYCWVEGHTDLIGGEESNLQLSQRRSEAVKSWLVNALQISPHRIIVRAFGKSQPVVLEGSIEEQAANRRVDIKMRKALPPPVKKVQPPPVETMIPKEPVEPIQPSVELITPAEPVEPEILAIPAKAEVVIEEEVSRAQVVEEPSEPKIPRAIPVEEDMSE